MLTVGVQFYQNYNHKSITDTITETVSRTANSTEVTKAERQTEKKSVTPTKTFHAGAVLAEARKKAGKIPGHARQDLFTVLIDTLDAFRIRKKNRKSIGKNPIPEKRSGE